MPQWVLDYAAAAAAGPAAAGGKGWNLGRLAVFGFDVPPGCILAAGAYRAFLEHNGLLPAVAGLAAVVAGQADAPGTVAQLDDLRAAITAGSMPPGLEEDLAAGLAAAGLAGEPVAVRSSATAEDGAAHSFAGIHRSFLNVRGLQAIVAAVKGCFASLWTPHALAYRRRLGLDDLTVAAGVVICRLVPAVASGVAFSADPASGRRDRVAIAANFGLGESVVLGSAEVDEFTVAVTNVSPARLVGGRIGQKRQVVRPDGPGGVRTEFLGDQERRAPVLENLELEKLALLVKRVEDALGEGAQPQDVEWAWDGYRFFLLQARPITALPWATFAALSGSQIIWSNANMKDAYPGVQSPLGWWLTSATHEVMLRRLAVWAGYAVPEGLTWSRLYQGRIYLNLSALQYGAWDAFGVAPAGTNRFIGGHQPEMALPRAPGDGGRRAARLARLAREMRRARGRAPAVFQHVREWVDRQVAEDLDRLNDRDFINRLWQMEQERREFLPETMIHNANAGAAAGLMAFLEPYFPGRGGALASALLAGAGGVVSAEHGYKLLVVAHIAGREPRARAYLLSEPFDPARWREALLDTQTAKALDIYLREYGYRGIYEMELMNPRWAEDPTYLLETVRGYLQAGMGSADPGREAAERRRRAEAEVAAGLRFRPLAYLAYRRLLRQARAGMRLREEAKAALVRLLWPLRRWALSAGRRLTHRRILAHPRDVFFLTGNELITLLMRHWDGRGVAALVGWRKARRQELERLDPPDVIQGERPQPRLAALPAEDAAAPDGRRPVVRGLGVAAGVAGGPARLVRRPEEGLRLHRGDVLVAPSTDPAWTPLFLRASAVVMEVGGYLSHGAIVAREYGIPAVANAAGAMAALREGEPLQVDGDRGLVFRQ